ncbi:helix-turn-helix transcriptional regulator [Kroppenstedtia pulmonis]|uniref:Helix-turn-helix transcriptional regulator n=1 Tax=Kroppenstedtia pulmonis TaxID=1380685 RepID=A0A7D3XNU7_9BACL|nr:tetratricopeptide repeat protein [Kroppenstedtia pulmonis]QKG83307.1 helix-turn-helix transcriptional regulator [Kroppenstedtia pulmonis]
MSHLDVNEIGEIIRKIRKEQGFRLEDLSDDNISPATISNIERGVPHVKQDKIRYLLNKLNIDPDQLPYLILQEQQELQDLEFALFSAEVTRDMGQPFESLQELKEIQIDDSHPYASHYYYLTGKCYAGLKKWSNAEHSFYQAIRMINQTPTLNQTNLEAASFAELGLCSYLQNDLQKALILTDNGLNAFVERGERIYVRHVLHLNKAIYLERLGRIGESMRVVQDSWDLFPEIDEIDTILTFYWLRSELLRRMGQYEEALYYAQRGLEIGRRNKNFDLMFDQWTVLGSVYVSMNKLNRAEVCFKKALHLKGISQKSKLITTYARLGVLYISQKNWDAAYEMIKEAIRLGEQYNNIPRFITALHVMGDLNYFRGNNKEAIPYYQRALELSVKHDFKKKQHNALLRLAQCWENVDERVFNELTNNIYAVQLELQKEEVSLLDESD